MFIHARARPCPSKANALMLKLPWARSARTLPALALAGALVFSAGVGGATAGALITGRDIQDGTIAGKDLRNHTITQKQMSQDAVAAMRTEWLAGNGAPAAGLGERGSWYVDATTGDAYRKNDEGWRKRVNIMGATGAPGAVGPQGATGAQGSQGSQGVKGDQGAKGDQGVAGADGAKWLQGSGAPAAGTGAVGDWYLDTVTYDAYEKTAAGWAAVVNLRGPVGPKGDKGDTGDTGAKGEVGAQGPTGSKGDKGDTGSQGPAGMQGLVGPKGDTGAQGPIGPIGPVGPAGPQGPQGIQGLTGPAGPAGGGLALSDGQGNTLGKVVSMTRSSTAVVTSTGHLLTINWDGTISNAQIYYTGANCTGEAYLNDGGSGNQRIYAKTAVWSGSFATFMVPETSSQGYSVSGPLTAQTIDNPACGTSAGARNGWKLVGVSRSQIGLPAGTGNTVSLPLSVG